VRLPCATHLPLYRQHQRLNAAGIHLSRATLTNLVHWSGALLAPIHRANLDSILSSQVLAMDETPIKAGRKPRDPPHRGSMKTAYFWPIYGDKDEIAFPFATTRGSAVVREALKEYVGVLLTDGYKVYDLYAKATEGIVHAQCRVGGGVAAPAPHRPGRAELPHPVLHGRASLAAA
jgi:transposase